MLHDEQQTGGAVGGDDNAVFGAGVDLPTCLSNLLALSKSAFTEACELFPELYTLMFEELKDDSAQFLQLASFNAAKEGSAFL